MGTASDSRNKRSEGNALSAKMEDILNIHNFYFSNYVFGEDFNVLIRPLLSSFNDENGFSIFINNGNAEYYSSVSSTILIALYHMKAIDDDFKNKIHESLFNLKNNTINKTVKAKNSDDTAAWDVSEGANCWTTSLVVESLLETGYSGDKIDEVKAAILWLKDQQKENGGWGFDNQGQSRILFTARAIYALHLGKELFDSESSRKDIERALDLGISFIKDNKKIRDDAAYWPIEIDSDEPDPTNTVFALWILDKFDLLDEEIKKRSLKYLKMDLQNKDVWDFTFVVTESDTKYGSHKIIISFTPCIPLVLIDLGVEPFDELCIKPIYWLKKNFKNGWILPHYKSENLTFVYALGLWTAMRWQKEITNRMMKSNLENSTEIANRMMISDSENSTYVGLRKRIKIFIIIIILLILLALMEYIIELMNDIYEIISAYYIQQGLLNTSATLISIAFGLVAIPKAIIYLDQSILNRRCSDWILKVIGKLNRLIYLK